MRKEVIALPGRLASKTSSMKKRKAGRPPNPNKKIRITISIRPSSDPAIEALVKKAKVSKGALLEWIALAPEAEKCRALLIEKAYYFVPPPI